jgi:hypothetical protein
VPYKVAGTIDTEIRTFKNPFPYSVGFPFYCELDSSAINGIVLNPIPEETLTNYCPLLTEGEIDIYEVNPPSFLSNSATTALWLDADDSSTITLVSGAVSEWRDKSGNTRHASQTTAGNRPVMSTLNGKGVLDFAQKWLLSTSDYSFQSVFCVFKTTSNIPSFAGFLSIRFVNATMVANSTSAINLLLNHWDTTLDCYYGGSSSTFKNGVAIDLSTKTTPSSSTNRFFPTVTTQYNITYADYSTNSGTGTKNLVIGSDSFSTSRLVNGQIAEIILFPSVLSQADRELVEGYLAWKWGLVANLPSNHPYKNDYPDQTLISTETISIYDFAQAP